MGDSTERDSLARERTALANERTLLSYSRTALGLAGVAFLVFKLVPTTLGLAASIITLMLAVYVWRMGLNRYRNTAIRIDQGNSG